MTVMTATEHKKIKPFAVAAIRNKGARRMHDTVAVTAAKDQTNPAVDQTILTSSLI